jgi:2-oxoglutarate dehydrogenase E2 component (dihydrolipoamide succinyltransferase)
MPQLGETVTEGTITRWLKQVGDQVAADEPLFEVSTDKVDSEVPAPIAGVLSEIRVPEGETADVGTVLAVLAEGESQGAVLAEGATEGAARPAAAPPVATQAPAAEVAAPEAPVATEAPVGEAPEPEAAATPAELETPAPVAEARAPEAAPAPVAETPPPVEAEPASAPAAEVPGPEPAPEAPAPVAAEPVAADGAAADNGGGRLTSPVVRRLMTEYGLDPDSVRGTGEGGRVTRKDVVDAVASRSSVTIPEPPDHGGVLGPDAPAPAAAAARAPAPATAPAAPEAPAPPAPPAAAPAAPAVAPPPPVAPQPASPPAPQPAPTQSTVVTPPPVPPAQVRIAAAAGDEVVPFSNIRRRTAEHMVRSKSTSAHVYTSVEVDFERIALVRDAHQAEWRAREGFSLTYLPFISRAFCDSVGEFPHVNASVDGNSLVVHHTIHLAVAVDLDFQGLIAPVIRNADSKRLRAIAREIRDLSTRARNKQLLPDEVLGGTFTITNPGPYGTYMTLPIINQPQVAILSTDGIDKRPVVVTGPDGGDVIAIRRTGILAIAWDHRAFDGAYAAAFLNRLKEIIETRDWAAELD